MLKLPCIQYFQLLKVDFVLGRVVTHRLDGLMANLNPTQIIKHYKYYKNIKLGYAWIIQTLV